MRLRLVNESELRSSVTINEAIAAMEKAFAAYSSKKANVPPVVHLDVPKGEGEVHIKAAHVLTSSVFVIKVASGFYANKSKGLPLGSGLMMVFSADSGFPEGMLIDNSYLTDLRTAAAGAVAAKYMAPSNVAQVGIIGAGVQGRLQAEALACVREYTRLVIYDHHAENINRYIADMKARVNAEIVAADSVENAVRGSKIVITATPSREPIVRASWIEKGTHITAVGSDGSHKQELDAQILGLADRVIADSIDQCARLGEIHHALEQSLLKLEDINGELGDVVMGKIQGRLSENEITVADLTGVGVQDAFIAELALQKAVSLGLGKDLEY